MTPVFKAIIVVVTVIILGIFAESIKAEDLISPNGDRAYSANQPFYLTLNDQPGKILACTPMEGPFYICRFGNVEDLK